MLVIERSIPECIKKSPMMQKGGFEIVNGLLPEPKREQMLAEAIRLYPESCQSYEPESDGEEIRGGSPARQFLSSQGGPVQDVFYQDNWLTGVLSDRTSNNIVTSGERGTFTYYVRAGDHLAIHRDVQSCDVAVVSCLLENSRPDQTGGCITIYPERIYEPLSSIRATPQEGALTIRLELGQTIFMFGGALPHSILPLGAEQTRIVSVLCFRVPQRD
ncbi:MAG: hypothetical protein QOJ42_456 [Acidobacteriaceae bacterium]|jgi:hypothetical protein|nr:hypothetical protein [Acidobacteriaceae bacterium]MDX6464639.1 hypothetical protein [Acidobacteriaceae bacterium]